MLGRREGEIQNRKHMEDCVSSSSVVITIGQRCADCFVLWQFRITGTIDGSLLLSN